MARRRCPRFVLRPVRPRRPAAGLRRLIPSSGKRRELLPAAVLPVRA